MVAVDRSGLPIHVFSDCDSTVAAIEKLRAGLPLPKPGKYQDRADLLPRLQAILTERQVQVTRYRNSRLEHQICHLNAIRKLRAEVDSDPRVSHRLALLRLQPRLSQLVGERGTVLNRLEKLDEGISLLQVEIEAVELAMRSLTVNTAAQSFLV